MRGTVEGERRWVNVINSRPAQTAILVWNQHEYVCASGVAAADECCQNDERPRFLPKVILWVIYLAKFAELNKNHVSGKGIIFDRRILCQF